MLSDADWLLLADHWWRLHLSPPTSSTWHCSVSIHHRKEDSLSAPTPLISNLSAVSFVCNTFLLLPSWLSLVSSNFFQSRYSCGFSGSFPSAVGSGTAVLPLIRGGGASLHRAERSWIQWRPVVLNSSHINHRTSAYKNQLVQCLSYKYWADDLCLLLLPSKCFPQKHLEMWCSIKQTITLEMCLFNCSLLCLIEYVISCCACAFLCSLFPWYHMSLVMSGSWSSTWS